MNTINISIPKKLRQQADYLVKSGYYASISDLVRDAMRKTIDKNQFDIWVDQTKEEESQGKTTTLKTKEDVDDFVDSL